VLREAGSKAAAEHRQFEAALKARRKEFDKRVEQYAAELAVVEGRNDIVKREVVASEVGCCGCRGASAAANQYRVLDGRLLLKWLDWWYAGGTVAAMHCC
jgi:dynein heavy chain